MFCWILAVKCLTVFSSICIVVLSDAGWSSMVARRAHNPKVVGSNPAPATKFSNPRFCRGFFLGLMTGVSESLYLKKVVWKLDVRVFRWLLFSIIFVDRVHATALVLSTNFVAWASPANHSRFQVTCPFYSGLTLNQYGVASPCRTICTVCGFVALSWFKFNPLYLRG